MPKTSGINERNEPATHPERVPASEYTPKFLSDLHARKQVLSVPENWTTDKALPPGIHWVIYPNGDLQRVGMD